MSPNWRAFPDENPNIVVECDAKGTVLYANPVAQDRFPDLLEAGWRHPLLAEIPGQIGGFATGRDEYVSREVSVEGSVFEQKICYGRDEDETVFRIYAHDVTALRRAEKEMESLAGRLVLAQEEERHRVSRELHDEAGQALAALKLSLQLIRDDVPGAKTEAALDEAVDLVEQTRDQLRMIAYDLHPPALDTVGLTAALEGFCTSFAARSGLEIDFAGDEVGDATDAVALCLYRFLQEALANTATHAAATRVRIELREQEDHLTFTVVDNGSGFDPDQGTGAGMGLAGMTERIELLGGSLRVDSAPGAGTRLSASLPNS